MTDDQLINLALVIGGLIAAAFGLLFALLFWPVLLLGGIGWLIAGPLGGVVGGGIGLLLMFK